MNLPKLTLRRLVTSVLFTLLWSGAASAQVAKGTCVLTKHAKLFKESTGMAFHARLQTGDSVSLIEDLGTRWEVAAADGTIGFLDTAWMRKVCTLSAPATPASEQLSADESKALAQTQATAAALNAAPQVGAVPAGGGLGSMALLPIEGERLDPSLVKICSNLIAAHLAEVPDRTLVTSDEIGAMLSLEEQKMALNCDDASCMAEIGGALGVDELVRVSLGKLGSKLIISMSRILVAEAAVLGRSTIKIDNVEDYYDEGFQRAVAEIYNLELKVAAAPKPQVAPQSKAKIPAAEPLSQNQAVVTHSASTPWGSYLSMILGGAAVGAGTYFGLQAQDKADLANTLDVGSQRAGQDAQTQALLANVFYGAGAVGLVTGLYLYFTADEGETAAVSLSESPDALQVRSFDFAPLSDGALILIGGTY